MDIAFRAVDADNHYYETVDACTRHLDKEFRAARGAGGAAGQSHAAARGRQAVPLHPEPDVRPDHRGRLHGPDVPRSGARGCRPAHAHAGRAAAAGVPRPRRAPRGDGRAGPRGRADVPDARVRHRAGAARRHPRDDGHAPGVQPLVGRRLGVLVPGPDHRGADAVARRSRGRARRARVVARTRRGAWCTSGRRRCPPPTAAAGRSAIPRTTRSGPASPKRRFRSRSTSATAATRRSPARGARGTTSSRSAASTSSRSWWCRTGRSTTRSAAWSSTACSTVTPRCGPRASRTAPTGCTS